ncbi:TIGR03067 domain-containing protein [Candidatus Obscuribacterales bacterium]|nr:TIGR03067 domain-containing protein [Candidatus Obscuribacterales bacterium]MBX3137596.1 TIGR03067 domain-containing protein [Candidatus Obscuribacterales bacterium]MBX3148615.1 TIGR03067 domain-containing protein [Candidatus Obscuribacterales bacterium]
MLDGLVGKWKVIGCQLNGRWLPYSIFQEFRYSFLANDTFKLEWAELSFPQYVGGFPKSETGKVVFGKSDKPSEIDLIPDDGPFAGKALLGIFELDHDVLKAIFSFPGTERPTVFNTKQGQVYEIWQRVE